MATIVNYKNNQISTFTTGTKTLKTSGKYMEDDVTITTSAGSATTPSTTITINPSINISSGGLITANVSGTQNITPAISAGYIDTGTAGTVSVTGSNTQQMTVKGATTYTPTTTNQTIVTGTYLTGTQTIEGDADLIASNIRHDKNIFNVNGTFGMKVATAETTLSARDTTITFTGLKALPLFFSIGTTSDITMNRSYRNLINITYDGTTTHSDTYYLSGGNSGYGRYFSTCTWNYNNGTLTVNSAGTGTTGYFYNGTWRLIYVYEE